MGVFKTSSLKIEESNLIIYFDNKSVARGGSRCK